MSTHEASVVESLNHVICELGRIRSALQAGGRFEDFGDRLYALSDVMDQITASPGLGLSAGDFEQWLQLAESLELDSRRADLALSI